jgi:hypothetical protein
MVKPRRASQPTLRSDTADDWHHRITPRKIIATAMKRLEARGEDARRSPLPAAM